MSDFNSSLPVRTQNNGDVVVKIADATTPTQQLAIDATGKPSVKLNDASGAAFSITNPLPVSIQTNGPGTEVNDYSVATAIAAAGTANHDYTVTALKTLLLTQIEAAASGKAKIEVQIETGIGTGIFNSKFVRFNSTATPNMSLLLSEPISVAAGVKVRIIKTNNDTQAQDMYSTISGNEN